MTLLSDIVEVGDRRIWATFYNLEVTTQERDLNNDNSVNPRVLVETASVDVREYVAIGEKLIDDNSDSWTVKEIAPSDGRYAASFTLSVEKDMIVLDG